MVPMKFPSVSVSTQVYVRHALCEEACSVVSQFKCPCVPLSTQLSSSSAAAAQTSPASHSNRPERSRSRVVQYTTAPVQSPSMVPCTISRCPVCTPARAGTRHCPGTPMSHHPQHPWTCSSYKFCHMKHFGEMNSNFLRIKHLDFSWVFIPVGCHSDIIHQIQRHHTYVKFQALSLRLFFLLYFREILALKLKCLDASKNGVTVRASFIVKV